MNKQLIDALENGLLRMQRGETLDSVLASKPELAEQLRPLLETAARARSASQAGLPADILARQRARGLALADDLRQGRNRSPLRIRIWRPAVTIFAVIALLALSSNGLLNASAHSIPGDSLYPLKRTIESTQLQFVSDPLQRQELEHTFSQRRVDETKSLISDQRVESVEFNGVVSSLSADAWMVSGITVVITPNTKIGSGIVVGSVIDVDGSTNTKGDVVATSLTLVTEPDQDQDINHPAGAITRTATPAASLQAPSETPAPSTHTGEGSDSEKSSEGQSHQKPGDGYSSGDHTPSPYSGSGSERGD